MFISMFTQWKGSNRITSMPPADDGNGDGDAENVFEREKRERGGWKGEGNVARTEVEEL